MRHHRYHRFSGKWGLLAIPFLMSPHPLLAETVKQLLTTIPAAMVRSSAPQNAQPLGDGGRGAR